MLITVDKRGSNNLPVSLRRQLGLVAGTCLDLSVADGGAFILQPVAVYPAVHLNEQGLATLKEARESGAAASGLTPRHARADHRPGQAHAETDPD